MGQFLAVILILLGRVSAAAPLECLKGLSGADLERRSQLKPGVSWTWLLEQGENPATGPIRKAVGKAVKGYSPIVYDIDLFAVSAQEIANLRAKDKVMICYVAGGSMQFARSATFDSNNRPIPCSRRKRKLARPELEPLLKEIPNEAIGGMIDAWPDNCWLDPRHPSVLKALEKIVLKAKEKGCDGVEFDNMDGGLDDENRGQAGFSKNAKEMTAAQLQFNAAVADMIRRHGLCAAIKNGHQYAAEQCAKFDLAVVEGIVAEGGEGLSSWKRCALKKPVLAAEYPGPKEFSNYKCPTTAGNLSVIYFKNRDFVDGGSSCGATGVSTKGEASEVQR